MTLPTKATYLLISQCGKNLILHHLSKDSAFFPLSRWPWFQSCPFSYNTLLSPLMRTSDFILLLHSLTLYNDIPLPGSHHSLEILSDLPPDSTVDQDGSGSTQATRVGRQPRVPATFRSSNSAAGSSTIDGNGMTGQPSHSIGQLTQRAVWPFQQLRSLQGVLGTSVWGTSHMLIPLLSFVWPAWGVPSVSFFFFFNIV